MLGNSYCDDVVFVRWCRFARSCDAHSKYAVKTLRRRLKSFVDPYTEADGIIVIVKIVVGEVDWIWGSPLGP